MVSDFLPRRPNMPPKTNPEQPQSNPFQTPGTIASEEERRLDTSSASPLNVEPPKKKRRSPKEWFQSLSKKQKIILAVVVAIVLIGGGVGAYLLLNKPEPTTPVVKKQAAKPAPKPTTVASNLTGLQVAPEVNDRTVTAIMIENSQDARPQSGIHQAGVIFEAVAEGGITRFLTLFQDTQPDYIGPVRSVRPYYIQWALGFDAPIAHAGGSAEALANMREWNVKDLNDHKSYFFRVSNRFAPHNLYTSMAKLNEYEASRNYGKSNYTSLARKAEAPSKTPNAKLIDFAISSSAFNAHYEYDPGTNSYKRSTGGAAHRDERSNQQMLPKVVVALVMPKGQSGIYSTYGTIGTGEAYVFQDGTVTKGAWRKDSRTAQFVFTDMNGAPLKLNPGQTWFTALGSATQITYAP